MDRVLSVLEGKLGLEGLTEPRDRALVRIGFAIALIAAVLRIVFWLYTQRYWEDALITCLHSENMASGFGMTHVRPGEPPLHGFTSPLSVLAPLIGDLIHVGWGMDFLKLVSLPASFLMVFYVLALGIHPSVRFPAPLAVLAMGYVAVEHQQILWGMAGMETQLSAAILMASVYYVVAWRPVALGVTLGLCMLVRPDYAFWTLIVGIYTVFREPRSILKVAGIALAVYLPWILFTTLYYGSPLPNTIVAKGLGYASWWDKAPVVDFAAVKRHVWMTMAEHLHILLSPIFAGHGSGQHIFFFEGPESPLANLMFFFAVVGTLAILFKRQWTLWPLAALVVTYSLYYVFLVPIIFGWYKVPYIATLLLLSVRGLQTCTAWIAWERVRTGIQAGVAVCYLSLFMGVLPLTFQTERQIQVHVENAVRKEAGLYLREHMKADEAVGCEPLGYMAYYSRGNVYDWPGLASRTVVAWSKAHPEERCLEGMLKGLQPEYLFLRDMELLFWFKDPQWFKDRYHVVKVFGVDPAVRPTIRWIDRNIDTRFRILKKNRPEDVLPYDASLWPTQLPDHEAQSPPLSSIASSESPAAPRG
ncbi:MAG: hypothetical protein HYV27_04460 [Candidatus Hydrogenedentes bacterium]|nr:hypothetical protein [Candidatus Hydrogenedentota bacterium]